MLTDHIYLLTFLPPFFFLTHIKETQNYCIEASALFTVLLY